MYNEFDAGQPAALQIPDAVVPDEARVCRKVVVISPHVDDAAFSLAATLKLLVRAGSTVRIVNCFTLTGFAPFTESDERLTVMTRRRHEEELFLHHLGGNSQADDLGLEDAPARTGLGVRAVVIQPSSARDIVVTALNLAGRLEKIGGDTTVLAPLAIGNHPDHYIARLAALEKYRRLPIAFYEDLPYAASATQERIAGAVKETAAMLEEELQAVTVRWPGDFLWKQQCCSYYKSQISQAGVQKILHYMQGNHGEKLWCSQRFMNNWKWLWASSGSLNHNQCLAVPVGGQEADLQP